MPVKFYAYTMEVFKHSEKLLTRTTNTPVDMVAELHLDNAVLLKTVEIPRGSIEFYQSATLTYILTVTWELTK